MYFGNGSLSVGGSNLRTGGRLSLFMAHRKAESVPLLKVGLT